MEVIVYPNNDVNRIVTYKDVISCYPADGVYYINYVNPLKMRIQVIYPLHYLRCVTVTEE